MKDDSRPNQIATIEWISVKDAKPTQSGDFLVAVRGKFVALAEWQPLHGYWGINREDFFSESEITHWAMLPPLPQE